jgi:hypothetical protein
VLLPLQGHTCFVEVSVVCQHQYKGPALLKHKSVYQTEGQQTVAYLQPLARGLPVRTNTISRFASDAAIVSHKSYYFALVRITGFMDFVHRVEF